MVHNSLLLASFITYHELLVLKKFALPFLEFFQRRHLFKWHKIICFLRHTCLCFITVLLSLASALLDSPYVLLFDFRLPTYYVHTVQFYNDTTLTILSGLLPWFNTYMHRYVGDYTDAYTSRYIINPQWLVMDHYVVTVTGGLKHELLNFMMSLMMLRISLKLTL